MKKTIVVKNLNHMVTLNSLIIQFKTLWVMFWKDFTWNHTTHIKQFVPVVVYQKIMQLVKTDLTAWRIGEIKTTVECWLELKTTRICVHMIQCSAPIITFPCSAHHESWVKTLIWHIHQTVNFIINFHVDVIPFFYSQNF